ncbi:spermidine synthase spee [Helicobacter aurati]|uniref:Spermidine synthase spee n=2 Tax=Helicobacter aurati TaxID=137778 RepID=A0A3D8J177_9HELI|nr:spermidine synthase spee [Helicobacter aurati]
MQLVIHNKFADYKADSISVELFDSYAFGQIALVHYKDRVQHNQEILVERFVNAQNEMLTYIPYCVHPWAKRVLLYGTLNCEIAYLFALQGLEVDIVLPNKEALYTLSGFLPHFKAIEQHKNIAFYANFSSLKKADYDIVLHLGEVKEHELDALGKLSSKEGIVIYRLVNLYLEPSLALQFLDKAKAFSHILMPFVISCLENSFFVFASKRFHPLADLLLQRVDMLENLTFYNAHLHNSAFRLPTLIQKLTAPYVKN